MITLFDPVLGLLQLRAAPYTVPTFTIGSREVRAVTRNRALADGQIDDTRYSGARAVTIGIVLNEDSCDSGDTMQKLYDRVLPYMKASRRPILTWSLPGSDGDRRQLTVRGDSAPVNISGNKHQGLLLSFRAPEGSITSAGDPVCILLDPATDTEAGRTYDQTYDKTYPPSLAVGDRLIHNGGNDDAHWTATIYGAVTNPFLKINGITITFDQNGGLDLPSGSSVVIDTLTRTIYLNGNPADPRYDRTNFAAWSWADLLLDPGDNTIRFGGSVLAGGQTQFCTIAHWAG